MVAKRLRSRIQEARQEGFSAGTRDEREAVYAFLETEAKKYQEPNPGAYAAIRRLAAEVFCGYHVFKVG